VQVALDNVVRTSDLNFLTVLAIGFGLLVLINCVASLLRAFVLLAAGSSLGFGISVNIARRLFRLPIGWFERRQVGDILSRFQSIAPIRSLLTEGAVASLVDGGMAIVTLLAMFIYSASLAMLALFAFGSYLVVRIISFAAQRRAQEDVIVNTGREQTVLIETLRGITTLRLFSKESSRLSLWQSRYAESLNSMVNLQRISIWQTTASVFIFGIESVVSVWLLVRMIIDGGFSIGMMYAFVAYKSQFLLRSSTLIDQGIALKMLGLHLERLSDIALTPEALSFSIDQSQAQDELRTIELRNVSFKYAQYEPLVLDGIDLCVAFGEHIAITGPSGGGKSTLVKVLLGLAEPTEGEYLLNGVSLRTFGYARFYEQTAAVLQNDTLFAGTLAQNIALFDEDADLDQIIAAAKAAAIHDEILTMPLRYETLVGDMGSTLSGGQKQRVILARALYRKPRLLIMDEATSHLDANCEAQVNQAISALGITRIVIAHRQETINAADKTLTVVGGRIL
jgi:ATP-binding cassette subfamily B protein RaxB